MGTRSKPRKFVTNVVFDKAKNKLVRVTEPDHTLRAPGRMRPHGIKRQTAATFKDALADILAGFVKDAAKGKPRTFLPKRPPTPPGLSRRAFIKARKTGTADLTQMTPRQLAKYGENFPRMAKHEFTRRAEIERSLQKQVDGLAKR